MHFADLPLDSDHVARVKQIANPWNCALCGGLFNQNENKHPIPECAGFLCDRCQLLHGADFAKELKPPKKVAKKGLEKYF